MWRLLSARATRPARSRAWLLQQRAHIDTKQIGQPNQRFQRELGPPALYSLNVTLANPRVFTERRLRQPVLASEFRHPEPNVALDLTYVSSTHRAAIACGAMEQPGSDCSGSFLSQ